MDSPKSKEMPRDKFKFFTGVQSFKALTPKIYLITNGLGVRQVLMFPE
jgi:hypothetical protein